MRSVLKIDTQEKHTEGRYTDRRRVGNVTTEAEIGEIGVRGHSKTHRGEGDRKTKAEIVVK